MGRKQLHVCQATNKWSFTQEDLVIAKNGKAFDKPESLAMSAQNNSKRTNYVKARKKKKKNKTQQIADVDYKVIYTKRSVT